MSRADMHNYICQRAAHAIISEIGEYRVSTDALQVINQFLDEFLALLLSKSQSLDLARVKAAVSALLPSTLGRNAIVEAELEVKNYTESEAVDYRVYELNQALGTTAAFPLDATLPLLKDKAADFCTLADRDKSNSTRTNPLNERDAIEISPIVTVYATAVLEHVAEYVLTAITLTVENEDTYNIRIKDVFLALDMDEHVSSLFRQMDLRDKIEKRVLPNNASLSPRSMTASAPVSRKQSYLQFSTVSAVTTPTTPTISAMDHLKGLPLHFDFEDEQEVEKEIDFMDQDDGTIFPSRASTLSPNGMPTANSNYSMRSQNSQTFRPRSVLTSSTSNATVSTGNSLGSNKKRFNIFKKDRHSIHMEDEKGRMDTPVYDPDSVTMTFEDVIRSSGTVRVSLTPNRLKSIEVKDPLADDPPVQRRLSWERHSQSAPRMSVNIPSRAQTPTSHRLPTPNQTDISFDASLKDLVAQPYNARPQSPLTISSKKSSMSDIKTPDNTTRFENPREAPKPPIIPVNVPLTPQSSTSSCNSKSRQHPSSLSRNDSSPTIAHQGNLGNKKSREHLQRPTESDEDREKATGILHASKSPVPPLPPLPRPPARGYSPGPVRTDASLSLSGSTELGNHLVTPVKKKSVPDLRGEDERQVRFTVDKLDLPERPSSVAAKRASMTGSPRRESFQEVAVQHRRLSAAGSVGMSIKAWDEIVKQNAGRLGKKGRMTNSPSQTLVEHEEDGSDGNSSSSCSSNSGSEDNASHTSRVQRKPLESKVLDKVMKFERAQSPEEVTLQRRKVHSMYLSRESSVVEHNRSIKAPLSNPATPTPGMTRVDAAVQTEQVFRSDSAKSEDEDEDKEGSDTGLVDGDEEWFLQDEDWDDVPEQEIAVVEWLLGEA